MESRLALLMDRQSKNSMTNSFTPAEKKETNLGNI